jgi:hypothetical protein
MKVHFKVAVVLGDRCDTSAGLFDDRDFLLVEAGRLPFGLNTPLRGKESGNNAIHRFLLH